MIIIITEIWFASLRDWPIDIGLVILGGCFFFFVLFTTFVRLRDPFGCVIYLLSIAVIVSSC